MNTYNAPDVAWPWEIPSGWTWVAAGEVAQVVGGGTPLTGDIANWTGGDIPWITPADLAGYNGKLISRGARNITKRGLESSGARLLPAGSVLFSSRAPIGYVAVANNSLTTNQGFKSLVLPDAIDSSYVYYYLKRAKELAVALANGTTFPEISGANTARIPLPIAPLSEQRRIVMAIEEQFTRLDAAVRSLQRVRVNLKRYRASVLKAASDGRLVPIEAELARADGRTYEPGIALLGRIAEERDSWVRAARGATLRATHGRQPEFTEAIKLPPPSPGSDGLPDLPEGWAWTRAGQLCGFITKGTTPSAAKMAANAGEVPFIKVYNLTFTGMLDFSINPTFIDRATHLCELARSRLLAGDVLMNIVGPPLGKVSIVPPSFPEWNMNQAIAVFRVMPSFDRDFMSICLRSEGILRWAVTRAKATAGQFNLTLEICRNLPLPVPPLAEQKRIAAEVERRMSLLSDLDASVEANMKRAERLRQSILKCAFEGKLVQQDPTEAPPTILPAQIRADRNHRTSHRNPIQTPSNVGATLVQSALGV